MTPEETADAGRRLYKAGQYAEAIPLLESAVEAFPEDETLWADLVRAAHHNGQSAQAVEFSKQAIRHHPRSGWLWRQLGCELTACDRLDEAEKALDHASGLLGERDEWLWRYYVELHRKQKDPEREIAAWENLYELGSANAIDLNNAGIAYYKNKDYAKALQFYREAVLAAPSVYPLYNMGLVFNAPEVSQDADAADAYRRALALQPDYRIAIEHLETTKRTLGPLAEKARAHAANIIQAHEFFQFYLNPFELLQIEEFDPYEELDAKLIQRTKKRLLQEIDLNDGRVSWLDDCPLEKSRVMAVVDEIDDETVRYCHWAVFENKPLLQFLTRGDIGHFLYADDYFPRDTLELLDYDPVFRTFLSRPFAKQYNLVLTRAIERRLLSVVEALFDGRRWVEPEDEDVCFEGANRHIGELVEKMRTKANDSLQRKVTIAEVEDFFRQNSLPELLNLLPTPFASFQREFVEQLRVVAIRCFNEHRDAVMSKSILDLCKRFTSRSVEVSKRLEEDFETIERMIAEERKQDAEDRQYDFSAVLRQNERIEITKTGITLGSASVAASDVESIRWGVFVQVINGIEVSHV
ncbi:MAG TPA: tetratricopeptide repeat protein, partial [Acidobacteriota bacterium]|nr:tetratricopeptide repeat protein [Acidobacteriota bacterium]